LNSAAADVWNTDFQLSHASVSPGHQRRVDQFGGVVANLYLQRKRQLKAGRIQADYFAVLGGIGKRVQRAIAQTCMGQGASTVYELSIGRDMDEHRWIGVPDRKKTSIRAHTVDVNLHFCGGT